MKFPALFSKTASDIEFNWSWNCQEARTLSFTEVEPIAFNKKLALQEEDEEIEKIIKGLKSERLFFEPEATSSMVEVKEGTQVKESMILTMESRFPYLDFKKSMEEMVEAHGLGDSWEDLYQLLCWYMRLNTKSNHGIILTAFVDLLVERVSLSSKECASSSTATKKETPSPSFHLSLETSSSCCSASSSCSCDCVSSSPLSEFHDVIKES